MPETLQVEVVFAMPDEQQLITVSLPQGATVADAIAASDIAAKFPDVDLAALPAGIWGRPADRQAVVKNGDRVEIYRRLLRDPREARRELAQAGLTMRRTDERE